MLKNIVFWTFVFIVWMITIYGQLWSSLLLMFASESKNEKFHVVFLLNFGTRILLCYSRLKSVFEFSFTHLYKKTAIIFRLCRITIFLKFFVSHNNVCNVLRFEELSFVGYHLHIYAFFGLIICKYFYIKTLI